MRSSCSSQNAMSSGRLALDDVTGGVEDVLGPPAGRVGGGGLRLHQLEAHDLGVEAVGLRQVGHGDGNVVVRHRPSIAYRRPSMRARRGTGRRLGGGRRATPPRSVAATVTTDDADLPSGRPARRRCRGRRVHRRVGARRAPPPSCAPAPSSGAATSPAPAISSEDVLASARRSGSTGSSAASTAGTTAGRSSCPSPPEGEPPAGLHPRRAQRARPTPRTSPREVAALESLVGGADPVYAVGRAGGPGLLRAGAARGWSRGRPSGGRPRFCFDEATGAPDATAGWPTRAGSSR